MPSKSNNKFPSKYSQSMGQSDIKINKMSGTLHSRHITVKEASLEFSTVAIHKF